MINIDNAKQYIVKSKPAISCNNGITVDFSSVVGEDGSIDIGDSIVYDKLRCAIAILETITIKSPTTYYTAR